MYWRIRYEQKEKNLQEVATTDFTGNYDLASLRYWLAFMPNNRFALKNIVEVNRASSETELPTFGFLLSQELSYALKKVPLSFDLRYELFDAVNYDNRIYSYERDVPYVFSVPMLYGRGSRWFFNCQCNLSKHLSFWLKFAETVYVDRNVISSGLEKINGSHKTDARAMVRFRF